MKDCNKQHEFEPTDNQGYEIECVHCGRYVSIYKGEDWDKGLS